MGKRASAAGAGGIEHKLYSHMTKISNETRKALIKDFS